MQINLVMEYGGGNSLDQYIKSRPEGALNEKEAKLIFRQVLSAVQYLHSMNVAHRDIKCENILLNKHLNLKLIDFGFSLIGRMWVMQLIKTTNTSIPIMALRRIWLRRWRQRRPITPSLRIGGHRVCCFL
jgi:serine/threonine protein kinase